MREYWTTVSFIILTLECLCLALVSTATCWFRDARRIFIAAGAFCNTLTGGAVSVCVPMVLVDTTLRDFLDLGAFSVTLMMLGSGMFSWLLDCRVSLSRRVSVLAKLVLSFGRLCSKCGC